MTRERSDLQAAFTIVLLSFLVLSLFLVRQHQATGGLSGFPLDDSYIHLQFARNLALGNGLAFLPERPVAGSTAPLWTAMLSMGFLFSAGFAVAWAKVLGVALFVFAAVDLAGLARDLGARRWIATLAGGLVVLTETLTFSALSGMEVPLFVALLVRGMRCWVAEERRGDGGFVTAGIMLFAISGLARPEGLLVVCLAFAERLVRRVSAGQSLAGATRPRRQTALALLRGAGLVVLILAPTAMLFFLWNGSMLPTTFAVKAGGGHRLVPSSRDVWRFGEVLFRVQPWMTVLAGAGMVSLLRRGRSLLPGLWLAGMPLAYSALNAPGRPVLLGNFGRYGFPLLPFVVLLGCLALDDIVEHVVCHGTFSRWFANQTAWRSRVAAGLVVVVIALPSVLSTIQGANRSALAVRNVQQSDVAAARWIAENLPGARIATQDIGALGFFSQHNTAGGSSVGNAVQIVDLVGLVNPEILPFLRGPRRGTHPSGLGGLFEFVDRARVDYLLLFPRSYGGMNALLELRPDLEVVRRFKVEQNVAMAAEELVLLRMPGAKSQGSS